MDTFYDEVTETLRQKPTLYTILCGDFNAKIGFKSDRFEYVLGKFVNPGRNERGKNLLNYLLENSLYQMNSFFYKKPQRRWTWKSPDGKTRNEIDYIIRDNIHIIKDVTVLNSFTTRSDHRLIRATLELNIRKERNRMVNKRTQPRNEQEFQKYINNALKEIITNDLDLLNVSITHTIAEAQMRFCTKTEREERIRPMTKL